MQNVNKKGDADGDTYKRTHPKYISIFYLFKDFYLPPGQVVPNNERDWLQGMCIPLKRISIKSHKNWSLSVSRKRQFYSSTN